MGEDGIVGDVGIEELFKNMIFGVEEAHGGDGLGGGMKITSVPNSSVCN